MSLIGVLLLASCGKTETSTDTQTTTSAGQHTGTTTNKDPCLKVATMTMDMVYGWSAATQKTVPVIDTQNQLPIRSTFRVSLGGREWDGDTSLPGQPDRWCFVEWTIDGMSDDGLSPGSLLSLSGLEQGMGTTNCGRESAPGASDLVDICPRFFGDQDPVAVMSTQNWQFRFGGEVGAAVDGIPIYFAPAGYVEENFWGSDVSSNLFSRIDSLSYGWKIDEYGATILDQDDQTVKFLRSEVEGPEGLPDGVYFDVIPWIFSI